MHPASDSELNSSDADPESHSPTDNFHKQHHARFDCIFVCRFLRLVPQFCSIPHFVFLVIPLLVFCVTAAFLEYYMTFVQAELITDVAFLAKKQKVSMSSLWEALGKVTVFLLAKAAVESLAGLCRMLLLILWRKRLTVRLLGCYFRDQHFYHIVTQSKRFPLSSKIDSPDQRIASDAYVLVQAIADSVEMIFACCARAILMVYFLVKGGCSLILVPVFVWPIFAAVGFGFIFQPVATAVFQKDQKDGAFRLGHASVRQNAESIAFFDPPAGITEQSRLRKVFNVLVTVWMRLIAWQSVVQSWTSVVVSLPALLDCLALFLMIEFRVTPFHKPSDLQKSAKKVMFLFMLSNHAGNAVQQLFQLSKPMDEIIGNTARIAEVFEATLAFQPAFEESESRRSKNVVVDLPDFVVRDLQVSTPSNQTLLHQVSFRLGEGDSLLMCGPSGSGKTSTVRTLAGIWKSPHGIVSSPDRLFFIPQNSRLVRGSLADNVAYPFTLLRSLHPSELRDCLAKACCVDLADRFPCTSNSPLVDWNEVLSGGEKQRLALARMFYHRPTIAVLDEATSALDSVAEVEIYQNARAAGITLLSTSARKSGPLNEFHSQLMLIDNRRLLSMDEMIVNPESRGFVWRTIEKKEGFHDFDFSDIGEKSEGEFAGKSLNDSRDQTNDHVGDAGINKTFFRRLCRLFRQWFFVPSCRWWFGIALVALFTAMTSAVRVPLLMEQNAILASLCVQDTTGIVTRMISYGSLVLLLALLTALSSLTAGFEEIVLRETLTNRVSGSYFQDRIFYKMNVLDKKIDNPDQRICHDVSELAKSFVTIQSSLVGSVVSILTVLIVSFSSYGPLMLLAAVLIMVFCGLVEIFLMWLLARYRYTYLKREGYFRSHLTLIAEHADSIALTNGITKEASLSSAKLEQVIKTQLVFEAFVVLDSTFKKCILGVSELIGYFILLIAIVSGLMKLGSQSIVKVIQIVNNNHSFMRKIMSSLSSLLDTAVVVGEMSGNVARVSEMVEGMEEISGWNLVDNRHFHSKVEDDVHDQEVLLLVEGFTACDPSGRTLFRDLNLRVEKGMRILIRGRSGCGKSTLLRCLAALWPTGSNGTISWLDSARPFFLSQSPYLSEDTIRRNVFFPSCPSDDDDGDDDDYDTDDIPHWLISSALSGFLDDRFQDRTDWSRVLSLGQKQMVSFARLETNRCDVALVDEGTSALSEDAEKELYARLTGDDSVTLLSVSHRNSLEDFHTHLLEFDGNGGWRFAAKEEILADIVEL